jgi:ribosome-associated protein
MKKLSTLAKKKLVISALEDIKARDIQAIDVRKVTDIFDWIVVASAESARQTRALSRHVRDRLKEAGSSIIGTEGEETGDWILVDAGDVVAHVMQPAVRQLYALEDLFGEGKFDDVVNSTVPVGRAKRRDGEAGGRGAHAAEDEPKPRTRKAAARPKARARTTAKATPKARPKATPKVRPKATPKARPKARPAAKKKPRRKAS